MRSKVIVFINNILDCLFHVCQGKIKVFKEEFLFEDSRLHKDHRIRSCSVLYGTGSITSGMHPNNIVCRGQSADAYGFFFFVSEDCSGKEFFRISM